MTISGSDEVGAQIWEGFGTWLAWVGSEGTLMVGRRAAWPGRKKVPTQIFWERCGEKDFWERRSESLSSISNFTDTPTQNPQCLADFTMAGTINKPKSM